MLKPPPSPSPEIPARLWDARDLAKFLGYAEGTILRLTSDEPHKLPPRVGALGRQRWLPKAVYAWVREQSATPQINRRKGGRPRNRG